MEYTSDNFLMLGTFMRLTGEEIEVEDLHFLERGNHHLIQYRC